MRKIIAVLIGMLFFDAQLFSYFEPGTVWEMNGESTPTNAALGNRGGGSFNSSIGSGGGVDYSTWQFPIAFGGITTLALDNVTLLSTSAAADWKGNAVYFTGGSNLNLSAPWWQITQVVAGVSFTVSPATAVVNGITVASGVVAGGSMNLGGALSGNGQSFSTLQNTEDAIFEAQSASNTLYVKTGNTIYTWTLVTPSFSLYSQSTPTYITGYNTVRGDDPNPFGASTTAPTINLGVNQFSLALGQTYKNLKIVGTASSMFVASLGNKNRFINMKFSNISSTVDRPAFSINVGDGMYFENVEIVSQMGVGFSLTANISNNPFFNGVYIHDCSTAILQLSGAGNSMFITNSIISSNMNAGIVNLANAVNGGHINLINNTFLGFDNISVSTMIVNLGSGTINAVNCIFYNGHTAAQVRDVPNALSVNRKNSYYGFTSTFSGVANSVYFDTATAWGFNPNFVNSTEIFGTTATISGTTLLMHQGGTFDNAKITDNLDYLQCHRGSGSVNKGYLIVGHSSFSLTLNQTIGTNATADKVWTIRTGKDFRVGATMKALGTPAIVSGSTGTAYIDLGAVQRIEPTGVGGGGGSFTFVQ